MLALATNKMDCTFESVERKEIEMVTLVSHKCHVTGSRKPNHFSLAQIM